MNLERRSLERSPEADYFWAVVYELRQPLTAITGQIQLARRFVATDARRASLALEEVTKQIARIDRVLVELHDRATSAKEATL